MTRAPFPRCGGVLVAAAFVLLCACRAGPYAGTPQYVLPETRTTAARWLNDALAFEGRGLSDVRADQLTLQWKDRRRITGSHARLIPRELELLSVRRVSPPARHGVHYEVKVEASGGVVTFAFESGPAASKAEVAFQRLATPLSRDEEAALIEPHRRVISEQVQEYQATGIRPDRRSEVDALADAIQRLESITGRSYGHDFNAALKWHEHLSKR